MAGFIFRLSQPLAIDENRVLKGFPYISIGELASDEGGWFSEVSDFFNDRFYLRDAMIRTKNQINWKIFYTSGDNGVYSDSDNYLFYKSVMDRELILNERMSEEDLDVVVTDLINLKKYCDEKGIRFVFFIPPQKCEIKNEINSKIAVRRPDEPVYFRLCRKIESKKELASSYIDAYSILSKAEEEYSTYYKTDFHWNTYGATRVFSEAVNRLANKTCYSDDDYHIEIRNMTGLMNNNIAMLSKPISEKNVVVVKNEAITSELLDGVEPNNAYHWHNTKEAPLGSVLVVGESFSNYLFHDSESGIMDCFTDYYWVHSDNSEGVLSNYADKIDCFIFEKIEVSISGMDRYISMLY